MSFFDIGHPCYDQLTPVKNIADLSLELIDVTCFFKFAADQKLFPIGSRAMSGS